MLVLLPYLRRLCVVMMLLLLLLELRDFVQYSCIKGTDAYEAAKDTNDCLWLLKIICGICLSYESSKPKIVSLHDALEQYIIFRQDTKSNGDIFKAFNSLVSVYEHLSGTLVHGTAYDDEINTIVSESSQDEPIAKKKATRLI